MKHLFLCAVAFACTLGASAAAMDARVRRVPAAVTEAVFSAPSEETVAALAKSLTGGLSDTSAKVKVLHDWICDNIAYDTDVFTDEGAGSQDYPVVLAKRRAVCSGYSYLMYVLCHFAGIEAELVPGWSKGAFYPGYLREKTDHMWNAIKIGGRWQLVDVTWDAGYVDGRTFIKHYSTDWLRLTAEQFIYSHLPEDEEKQFLPAAKVRTPEQFVAEPYMRGAFFANGLSFGASVPGYENAIDGAAAYDFVLGKAGVQVRVDVEGNSGSVEQAAWTSRRGKTVTALFDVPDGGSYEAWVYAMTESAPVIPRVFEMRAFEGRIEPGARRLLAEGAITQEEHDLFTRSYYFVGQNRRYYYDEDLFDTKRSNAVTKILRELDELDILHDVLSFKLRAADGYGGYGSGALRFPVPYKTYLSAADTQLVSPQQGALTAGGEYDFSVTSKDFKSLGFVIGEELVPLVKNPKTGAFELTYTVPAGIETLPLFGSKDGRSFMSLWYYEVE